MAGQTRRAPRANPHRPTVLRRYPAARLHDFILFMANRGLRPTRPTGWNAVIIEEDEDGERILLIEVRDKRGVGYCKSTSGAVYPQDHKKQFNRALSDCDLKADRPCTSRTRWTPGPLQ